mmetsp:Transcript_52435/g.131852  ORF Transcript_52435/g.131852 Transcript_52435/m.131852 type:complete len:273 (-) Transcript_52435:35-853(-)
MDAFVPSPLPSPSPSPDPSDCRAELPLPLGITLYQPMVGLFAIFGLSIGFICHAHLRSRHTKSAWTYSTMFFVFGCMNTTGIFLNCFAPPTGTFSDANLFQMVVGISDGIFSSCSSFSFLFCAVSDWGWADDTKRSYQKVLLTCYGIIAALYAYGTVKELMGIFKFLYVDVTLYGMLAFFVLSLAWNIANKRVSVFLLAAITGGVLGFYCMRQGAIICAAVGPWINGEAVWYLFSDLSMLMLALYYSDTLNLRGGSVLYILPQGLRGTQVFV